MQPLTTHTGRAVALRRDDVDTDQIVPAEYCKRVVKSGYADGLFARWRKEPGFVLNQPAHAGATVLLAGRNFGIGSSREHAVWALMDGGFVAVVASGFGDIFRRNALNNGLVPVDQPVEVVQHLMAETERSPSYTVTVDLEDLQLRAGGRSWDFDVDRQARELLLQGLDTIDLTLRRTPQIDAYEQRRPSWLPTVPRGSAAELAAGGER
ncbi:3-isopropylmalate dehydratase small subunit [Streptomyces sp. NRRL F-5053]|uniref:3-isopropylmalate dehydratase small subunit n=1 Tax=Streptomyces sp. NRRL F-5053 TaxID=1463854 RepID=UPI0004CBC9B5|nr:3-isopropylmalate dehydratase small subunit [Streptomyces sp. NRRL F-5053]